MSIAIARLPTPIYNTPRIPFLHLPLKKDDQGRIVELETIALPGTRFVCLEATGIVVQVKTNDYPSPFPLYVDKRFLTFEDRGERRQSVPPAASIISTMRACKGSRYFWGGNWNRGIPEMASLYPESRTSDVLCNGVDCSGLLYEATGGSTPRNTSDLVKFGEELNIQQMPFDEMQQQLRPLDLMVWQGHVIIVIDSQTVIESRIGYGVIESDLRTRYNEAVEKLAGKPFYWRRWHRESAPKSGNRSFKTT